MLYPPSKNTWSQMLEQQDEQQDEGGTLVEKMIDYAIINDGYFIDILLIFY
jgi:hypothetical protein